jgi:hypothetical protein
MPPKMFHYNRAYMTPEQYSLTVKSLNSTSLQQTCSQKYSQYAKGSSGSGANARIVPNNCIKEQRVYNSRGQLIGKNFCILKFT